MITSKCTLTIDLDIIKKNYQNLQKICSESEVGAAVKANCYGLGVLHITPVFAKYGCRHFFVANQDEGVNLRKILNQQNLSSEFTNIYVLNGYFVGDKDDFLESNLIPVLNSLYQFELWQDLALQLNRKLPCLLHIDTGMNRLGMQEREFEALLEYVDNLEILCVMSHLSSSEEFDNELNIMQINKFKKLAALFPHAKKSLANSSGIFLGSNYHFDIVRPGAALYGINPAPYIKKSVVKNPLELTAPIVQIKELEQGEFVGYNGTYQANQNHLMATLPLGYADGYLRSLSNKGVVFINDKPASVIGRVSMDLITIDVSKIPKEELFLGQKVEIIGKNMSVDQMANLAGTNAYEILTMLGDRYNRVYKSVV
jgi:alanine racemase